jgi:dTMP kinase
MKGCFIVFEGIDGAGKTVQFKELAKKLKKENYEVVLTKEPTTQRPIGKLIRHVLYNSEVVTDEALALLFAADRADHTFDKIKPALAEGAVVLSDRYVYSSYAYQGKGMDSELDLKWIKTINKYIQIPDIVVFLDIPPEIGMNRLQQGQKRIQDDTYFEDIIKQEKIRSIYYKVLNLERKVKDLWEYEDNNNKINKEEYETAIAEGALVLRIDGTLSINKIFKIIYGYIISYLEKNEISKIEKNTYKIKELTNII